MDNDPKKVPLFGSSRILVSGDWTPTTTNERLLMIPKSGDFRGEVSVHGLQRSLGKEPHICNVCSKVFRCHQALGGHTKAHGPANQRRLLNRTQNEGFKKRAIDLSGLQARSSYCSSSNACESASNSNGPSMNSLFRHMRFQPEREWRGIQRPSSPKNSSPSSTISDVVAPKTDDHIDLSLSLSSISGWSETAERGRKSTNSNKSEEQSHTAVNEINPLLSNKQITRESEVTNPGFPSMKARWGDTNKSGEFLKLNTKDEPDIENTDKGGTCSKRKGKKIKLEPVLEDYEQISETSKPYTCKICNKSFRSYQALGGHSSGHSKRKRKLPVVKVEESGSALAVEIAIFPAQPGKSPKYEEGGSSRCQYLTGPVDAAPPNQPAGQGDGSRAARIILDFDLNKLPDMEPLGDGSQTNPFVLDD